jgi:RNA-splicing ligase RtcB
VKVDKSIRDWLLDVQKAKRITLEGNILKLLEADEDDEAFSKYIKDALEKDKEARRRRLDVTKQVQEQNKNLLASQEENERMNEELKAALNIAEEEKIKAEAAKAEAVIAKDAALNDLDIAQKRSQFELIGTIVRVALYVIIGVGFTTTAMYVVALVTKSDTQIIGSTWSNMFGILLTNAFSIVGTIMGVKYASEKKE